MLGIPMDFVASLSEEERAFLQAQLDALMPDAASIPKTFPDLDYDPFEEDRRFAFSSLDVALQAIAECVSEERGSQWKMGAVVASAIDAHGRYGTYKERAAAAFYTTRRLKTCEVLHRTFPPETRFPDQPLLLYETALKFDAPIAPVEKALEEEWSPREIGRST